MDDVYVRKVCDGDAEAFRYFIKKYKDMGYSVAFSIVKDEYIAEEVIQEAFINAFKGIRTFHFGSSFRTWFYRIVMNEAFLKLKKNKKGIIDFQSEYDHDIADESVILALQEDEQIYYINEALKMLPPKESLVLRLFYLEEESIKTVCEVTGWTVSNVKVILHRGRKNMLLALTNLMKLKI